MVYNQPTISFISLLLHYINTLSLNCNSIGFIYPLGVNIHTFQCRNSNVFDYEVLSQAPLGMLHYIWYIHIISLF
jgi:hypothetical protein